MTNGVLGVTYWQFGDIVRVDPKVNHSVPQPDDRRWMILVPARGSANRQWTLLCVTPGMVGGSAPIPAVSHWSSMFGFVRVEP